MQNSPLNSSPTNLTHSNPTQSPKFKQNSNSTQAEFTLENIDNFVFYDKPFLTFERILETYLATAPKGFLSFIKAIPLWLKSKLFLKETIAREFVAIYKALYPHKSKAEAKKFKQKVLDNLYFAEHHISHAASAFFPSPFESAGILTIDGVGEWTTTSIAKGDKSSISILKELHFPHSLGLLYSAFTYYLGFKINSGEYKVMGLAPYGVPKFKDVILQKLIDLKDDGSFALNLRYFGFLSGLKMTNNAFDALFGNAKRQPEAELKQVHFDIAASIQAVTNEIMLRLARTTAKLTNSRHLVLSGGVALNCVGNGVIYENLVLKERILDELWIQPASGDAGNALGCALALYYLEFGKERKLKSPALVGVDFASKSPSLAEGDLGGGSSLQNDKNSQNPLNSKENSQFLENSRIENSNAEFTHPQTPSAREGAYLSDFAQQGALNGANYTSQGEGVSRAVPQARQGALSYNYTTPQDSMQGSYLGLSYTNEQVKAELDAQNAVYERHEWGEARHIIAKALSDGKVVGFHQGRCEFGPRALGARSILGDPRNTTMQKTMNLKIKYRESFRPFAPSVLDFATSEYFKLHCPSPYMLLVANVAENKCFAMSEAAQKLFGIDKLNVIRSEIPAVTHIDYSARVQSVHRATNERYYELLEAFYQLTNCPVLVNTSFNVRGEPMVCSPLDSYACFMGTQMDLLAIEDFLLYKTAQPSENLAKFQNIKDRYELD